jgi:hypothetical protein
LDQPGGDGTLTAAGLPGQEKEAWCIRFVQPVVDGFENPGTAGEVLSELANIGRIIQSRRNGFQFPAAVRAMTACRRYLCATMFAHHGSAPLGGIEMIASSGARTVNRNGREKYLHYIAVGS